MSIKPKVINVEVYWADALKEGCHTVGTINIPGAHEGYLHLEFDIKILFLFTFHNCQAIKIQ